MTVLATGVRAPFRLLLGGRGVHGFPRCASPLGLSSLAGSTVRGLFHLRPQLGYFRAEVFDGGRITRDSVLQLRRSRMCDSRYSRMGGGRSTSEIVSFMFLRADMCFLK